MTADLDAIRARLAAATPGEWVAHEFHERGSGEVFLRVVETYSADVIAPDRVDCTSYCYGGTSRYTLGAADADLIAHAPADLAALVDEVESLRAAVHRVRALHHAHACPDLGDGPTPSLTACAIIHGGTCANVGTCSGCSQRHPCPTIRALDGAS